MNSIKIWQAVIVNGESSVTRIRDVIKQVQVPFQSSVFTLHYFLKNQFQGMFKCHTFDKQCITTVFLQLQHTSLWYVLFKRGFIPIYYYGTTDWLHHTPSTFQSFCNSLITCINTTCHSHHCANICWLIWPYICTILRHNHTVVENKGIPPPNSSGMLSLQKLLIVWI